MTSHGEGSKKEKKRAKAIPPERRRTIRDCETGDTVEFSDGSRAVLTAWVSGAPFGRMIIDGVEGEFTQLDADASISRVSGYR